VRITGESNSVGALMTVSGKRSAAGKLLLLAFLLFAVLASPVLASTSPLPAACPCTIWSSDSVPTVIDSGAGPGVELGVKFRSDVPGTITSLRFYKNAANTGTHIGNLWSSSGTLLATATFTNETASGWQTVTFSPAVAITANTVYVASYHTNSGHFSVDLNAFTSAGVDNPPLHALQNGVSGGNGVYMYGGTSAFPTSTYYSANYWVDVVFTPQAACPCTIWSGNTVPSSVDNGRDSPVELGVKFTSSSSGTITGIRFYKSSANTGTHVGNLWSSTGTLLATATFANETASGWQQVSFSSPVAINANTTYVASYHAMAGHYSADVGFFSTAGVNNPPLQALANGVNGGNGVYLYGSASGFPSNTYRAANYWVDVIFSTAGTTSSTSVPLVSIAVTSANPVINAGSSQQFVATGTYQDASTQDISTQVAWNSSNPTAATISGIGLATGQSAGSSNITAALNGITSPSAGLTVNTAPASVALPSGLLLRWTFDSATISGNTVTDSSSNNQTGSIYGNPVSVPGVSGQALQFNGTNSYVTALVGAPFTGNITLAAWIKTTNQSRPEAIISRYDAAGAGTGYLFRTDAAGHIEVVFGGANGGSINSPAVDTAVINDGQWHHVLAVITVGQGVQFYVDGKPTAYVPQSFWAGDPPGYFYVGLNSFTYFGNFFTGSIEDVQAYNRALSPSEANAVYLGVSIPPGSGSGSGSGGSGSTPPSTPPPVTGTGTNAVAFNGIDTTTQGAWKGAGNFKASPASSSLVYGKDGVILPDTESCDTACNPFPGYVSFGPQAVNSSTPGNVGAKPYKTHAFAAMVQGSVMGAEPGNPTDTNYFQCNYTFSNPAIPWAPMVAWTPSVDTREISEWNTCLGITTYYLELTFAGTHNFEVYVVDDQNGGTRLRSEQIQVLDGDTNAVLYDSGSFTNFTGGVYYKWTMTGHVKVKVINTSTNGTDAVINGAFFN